MNQKQGEGRIWCIRNREKEGFNASGTREEKDLIHQKQGEGRI